MFARDTSGDLALPPLTQATEKLYAIARPPEPDEGLPSSASLVMEARVVHSDVESSSALRFEAGTAAPFLNQLQSNIEWTQRDNLHSVPTDCDQRDERLGWTGDSALASEEALSQFDMGAFYHNWAKMIDESSPHGAVADTIPTRPGGGQNRHKYSKNRAASAGVLSTRRFSSSPVDSSPRLEASPPR